MKKTLFLLLFTSLVSAQNDTIWINSKGQLASKTTAELFRIIKKTAPLTFEISDYNLKNILVLSQKCSIDENKLVTGTFSKFYDNGKIKMEGNIQKGILNGSFFTYLNDGTKNKALFKNELMFDGKTLLENSKDCHRELIVEKGVEILEKNYNKNNRNSGYEIIKKTKYISYHKNKIIGQGILNQSGDKISGAFGKYYTNGNEMYLNNLDFYNNKREKYKEVFYYENGNKRQENNLGFNQNIESTNYFDEQGQKIGTLNCDLNQTYERQYDGQHITFDPDNKLVYIKNYKKGILEQAKEYKNGVKIRCIKFNDSGNRLYEENYNQKGIIESKLSYSDYNNQPENGTKYEDYTVTEYKNFEIVSHKQYYKSGELFSDLVNNNMFYFDENGLKIGTLTYSITRIDMQISTADKVDYKYPYQGTEYECIDGMLSCYKKYENGWLIEKGTFNDKKKLIKKQVFHPENNFQKEMILYYENGLKKIVKLFSSDEAELSAVYYDRKGSEISTYDFVTKTGTLIFYNDSDDIDQEFSYLNGKIISNKEYVETYNKNGFINKLDFFETKFYKD